MSACTRLCLARYLLLWHLVRTSDRWKGEEALLANMDAHLRHRAVNGHCKLALSGLPAYVQVGGADTGLVLHSALGLQRR